MATNDDERARAWLTTQKQEPDDVPQREEGRRERDGEVHCNDPKHAFSVELSQSLRGPTTVRIYAGGQLRHACFHSPLDRQRCSHPDTPTVREEGRRERDAEVQPEDWKAAWEDVKGHVTTIALMLNLDTSDPASVVEDVRTTLATLRRVADAARRVVNGRVPAVSAELEGSTWVHSRISDSLTNALRDALAALDAAGGGE